MTSRPTALLIPLVCGVVILGGCASAPASRLDAFQQRAELITQEIAASIPEELVEATPVIDSQGRLAQSSGDTPQTPAWWEVSASVDVVEAAGASESAATAVGDALVAAGWTAAGESGSDPLFQTDGYRRDGWSVTISWVRSEPGIIEDLGILVVSPDTVRGDHDEIHS